MPARKTDLKPDAQGRYRPYLGWKIGEDGIRRQHRFNLGTDRKEAERRIARLRELWAENEKAAGEPTWFPFALSAANQIAQGIYRIPYHLDVAYAEQMEDPVTEYAQMINVLRGQFPSLEIVPADPDLYAESLRRNTELENHAIKVVEDVLKTQGIVSKETSPPERLISGTLHEALDAYADHDIRKHNIKAGTDQLTLYGNLRLERVERFKEHHDDVPLVRLNYDRCEEMIRYWRQRPHKKDTGKITSRDNARHHISELLRFLRWLDQTDRFAWLMPRGVERIDRTIQGTDSERAAKLSAIQKSTYSVTELATLNHHATPIERLILYVGLNCAMGAAELGRLQIGDPLLSHMHEFADRLNFVSTENDSFVRTLRPKTTVFGEWLLWPETVEMLRWGVARRKKIAGFGPDALLIVSEHGKPWYNEVASKNPQAKFANVWKELIRRVRKEKDLENFRHLPFGTLRDTLPDVIRHRYSDELASLCVAHGSTFKGDKLLDCYTNKPFGRLHQAIRELHAHFAPVFAAAPSDPTAKPRRQTISLGTQERIRHLLAEKVPVTKIAKECGVDSATVYRIRDAGDAEGVCPRLAEEASDASVAPSTSQNGGDV